MSGEVEFNLLHCVAGVVLAIAVGFVCDYWVNRVRHKTTAPAQGNIE